MSELTWHIQLVASQTYAPLTSIVEWNEQLRALRLPVHMEGTYEPTDFTRGLFQVSYPVSYVTWHEVRPERKHSKQTRAWYRVRARAEHRKKFTVHSHRRWDAHPYYGRERSI